MNNDTKLLEGIIINIEIENQTQFDEITAAYEQGFKVFNYIGANLALLTKVAINLDYTEEDILIKHTRFISEGTPISFITSSGESLRAYKYYISD